MKKRILLVGAFDRYNYGDLLYPVILKGYFLKKYPLIEIVPCGLIEADMTKYGGERVSCIGRFLKDKSSEFVNYLVIGGGDLWGVDLYFSYLCLLGERFDRKLLGVLKTFFSGRVISRVIRVILGLPSDIPWIYSPDDFFTESHIFYNSVGGRIPYKLEKTASVKLKGADFISVRDSVTENIVNNLLQTSTIKLAPDLAILLSKLYPSEMLRSRTDTIRLFKEHNIIRKDYFCFQINGYFGNGKEKEIASLVSEVSRLLSAQAILLPIGWAPKHDDYVCLKKIKSFVSEAIIIDPPCSIWDIMSLISDARVFIGSSLHGCITAQSYAVPFIGIPEANKKLSAYLSDWGNDYCKEVVSFENLLSKIQKFGDCQSRTELEMNALRLIKLVEFNMDDLNTKLSKLMNG